MASLIGWIATIFRGAGMLASNADVVKYLVSIGNLCWLINGVLTKNAPLIASNAFCLVVMLIQLIKNRIEQNG